MSLETWLLFSSAALVVILIPGPLSLLMISNSLNYGLRRSYPAFLGGVIASICLLSASALGLGALLLASEQLFSALKIVGALYLFYLAWQSWKQSRLPAQAAQVPEAAPKPRFTALFGRAFVLGASNPNQVSDTSSGRPSSLVVGASGNDGERWSDITARMRSLPSLT